MEQIVSNQCAYVYLAIVVTMDPSSTYTDLSLDEGFDEK